MSSKLAWATVSSEQSWALQEDLVSNKTKEKENKKTNMKRLADSDDKEGLFRSVLVTGRLPA